MISNDITIMDNESKKTKTLIILGAGGYGRTIADVAEQSQRYERIEFLDDNVEEKCVIGGISEFRNHINSYSEFYPAIGDNSKRMEWINELLSQNAEVATIVHPSAYISPTAVLKKGCAILPGAIINTGVVIGMGCIVNIGSIIDHETELEDGVHVAPGAIVKGQNRIKAFSKIESGVIVERGQMQ